MSRAGTVGKRAELVGKRAELVGKRAELVGKTTTFGSLEKAYVEYLGKWEDMSIHIRK